MKFNVNQKAVLLKILSAVRNGRYVNILADFQEKLKARVLAKRLKSQTFQTCSKLDEISSVRVITDVDDTIKSSGGILFAPGLHFTRYSFSNN